MSMRRWLPVFVLAFLVFAPDVLHACPVCFDQNEKNRMAFFTTTIFLSALPLTIIGVMAWWIRRRTRAAAPPGPEAHPHLS